MRIPIWLRILLAVNLLVAAAALAVGYGASEIAGRVVEARLVAETARRTGAFLQQHTLPISDQLMRYLRQLHGAHFLAVRPRDGALLASSFEPGRAPAGPTLAGLVGRPSGTAVLGGQGYRFESRLLTDGQWGQGQTPQPVRLYSLVPRAEFARARSQAAGQIARVAGLVLAASTALAVGVGLTIARPIRRLARRMHALAEAPAEDALAARPAGPRAGPAEVARLAEAFDTLMARLADAQARRAHQERLATLGRVAACVVHEMRNPLSGLRMNLRILADELADRDRPDGAAESLDGAVREIERMSLYLDELTDLAAPPQRGRPAAAMQLDAKAPAEPEALIGSVIELFAGRARHLKIDLAAEVDPGMAAVRVDAGRVRQVLINLLSNALQAAGEGGCVTLAAEARDGGVRFSVADSGPGPASELADSLFEPFVTARDRSAGLGLYVCRRIVEAHGGSIGYDRREGRTVFAFDLPAESGEDQP